jgi:hypothetical protein
MQITYRGSVELIEADAQTRRVVLAAAGKDTKSAGTASADIVAVMVPDGDGTMVAVQAQIDVTGKPAQFGRSVMEEVGANIINQFAGRLEKMILEDSAGADATAAVAAAVPAAENDDALDLLEVVGPTTKRLVAAVIVAVLVLAWFLSRRR